MRRAAVLETSLPRAGVNDAQSAWALCRLGPRRDRRWRGRPCQGPSVTLTPVRRKFYAA